MGFVLHFQDPYYMVNPISSTQIAAEKKNTQISHAILKLKYLLISFLLQSQKI